MHKLADLILAHRKFIAGMVIVAAATSAWLTTKLEFNYSFWTLFVSDDPEVVNLLRHNETWGEDSALMYLALRARSGDALSVDNVQVIAGLEERLSAVPGVREVRSVLSTVAVDGSGDEMRVGPLSDGVPRNPAQAQKLRRAALRSRLIRGALLSKDGRTTGISVRVAESLRDAEDRNPVAQAVQRIALEATVSSDLTPYLIGIPIAQWVYSEKMVDDLTVFTIVSTLLLAAVLLLVFRSVAGVALPLFVVGVATLMTTATMAVTGEQVNMMNTAIPTLMLVIGIADGIHILANYADQVESGKARAVALHHTITHLGWACLLTSVTTAVGFASLGTARIATVASFGLHAAVGILYAYGANVTLIPVGLSIVRKANVRPKRRVSGDGSLVRILVGLGSFTQRRPWTTLTLSAAVLAVFGAGVLELRVESRMFEEVPEDDPIVQAHRAVEQEMAGATSYAIDVTTPPGVAVSVEVLAVLDELQQIATDHPAVSWSVGVVDLLKELNRAVRGGDESHFTLPKEPALIAQLLLLAEGEASERVLDADRERTRIWMRGPEVITSVWEDLRAKLEQHAALRMPPGVRVVVTGDSSMAQRALSAIIQDVLVSLLGATLIIFAVMALLFRSWRIGMLSMVPNLIPLLITVGVMGFLGINLRTSTVVIFSVSLGLAVDDTIHFLVRYRRERQAGQPPDAAVLSTMRSAGRPIVYTSFILAGGFWVLLLSNFNATRDVGLLGGVTLMSALFADLVVLPALLKVALPRGVQNTYTGAQPLDTAA